MRILEYFAFAFGLAADAFAVSVCLGMPMRKLTARGVLIPGLYFGVFQAAMPLAGYLAGTRFAESVLDFSHWIAFALLVFIGVKMVWNSFGRPEASDAPAPSLSPRKMLPLAVATSIDALAVGVSFAVMNVSVGPAVLCIGGVTLALSAAGVAIGHFFGLRFKAGAERIGGLILVFLGVKIIAEHFMGG